MRFVIPLKALILISFAVQTAPADIVERDSFENGSVADSDSSSYFWTPLSSSTLATTHTESAGQMELTAGDSSDNSAPSQSTALVSDPSTEFDIFTETRQFRVRGLSFTDNGSGFPMDKALFSFALISDGDSSAMADDAIIFEIRGDLSNVSLGYKINGGATTEVTLVSDPVRLVAGGDPVNSPDASFHPLMNPHDKLMVVPSEFDLSLEPGEVAGQIDYYLRLSGLKGNGERVQVIHTGSFPLEVADWSGNGTARVCLTALEDDVAAVNQNFTVSMDSFETLKPGAAASVVKNVLMIVCDDFRPQILTYNHNLSGMSAMHTPHLDLLAAEGTVFERAYNNIPLCGPSRLSFMSGARPYKEPGQNYGRYWDNSSLLRVGSSSSDGTANYNYAGETIPQHFKNHGYATRSWGKIYHEVNSDWTAVSYPLNQGESYGHYAEPAWDLASRIKTGWNTSKFVGTGAKNPGYAYEIGDGSAFLTRADVTDVNVVYYSDERRYNPDAVRLDKVITDLRDLEDERLLLAVGLTSAHLPFKQRQEFWDLYPADNIVIPHNDGESVNAPSASFHSSDPSSRSPEYRSYAGVPGRNSSTTIEETDGRYGQSLRHETIRGYYAAASYIDAEIGRLVESLKYTYDGEGNRYYDNTVIALWGDHGFHIGEHTSWGKKTNYRVSNQVPLLVRSPDMKGGQRVKRLVELVDVYPTLCDLSGTGLPSTGHLEGSSMVPLMQNPERPWKPAVFSRYMKGDNIQTERFSYTEYVNNNDNVVANMLYDLLLDPDETYNIAPSNPTLVSELSAYLGVGAIGKRDAWKAFVDESNSNLPDVTSLTLSEPVYPSDYFDKLASRTPQFPVEVSYDVRRTASSTNFDLHLAGISDNPYDSYSIYYTTDGSSPLLDYSVSEEIIGIDSGSFTYVQNFDSLPIHDTGADGGDDVNRDPLAWTNGITLTGWAREINPLAVTDGQNDYSGNNGFLGAEDNSGFHNVGADGDSERALGFIGRDDDSYPAALTLTFRNISGATIDSFDLSYTGEQWFRSAYPVNLEFQYAIGSAVSASPLDETPSWVDVNALDFVPLETGNNREMNGNEAANQSLLSVSNIAISLPPEDFITFRWSYPGPIGITGTGMFVDDVSVNFSGSGSGSEVTDGIVYTGPLALALDSAHTINAMAINASGEVSAVKTISLNVSGSTPTSPPDIKWLSPSDGAVLTPGGTTTLRALVTDGDALVNSVKFFAADTELGEDTLPPYTFDWTPVPIGQYPLHARAYDANGFEVLSTTVQVLVDTDSINLLSNSGFELGNLSDWDTIGSGAEGVAVGVARSGGFAWLNSSSTDLIVNPGFELGNKTGWIENGGQTSSIVSDPVHTGDYAWLTDQKTVTWAGPTIELDQIMVDGQTYTVAVQARLKEGVAATDVNLRVNKKYEGEENESTIIETASVTDAEWVELAGNYTLSLDPGKTLENLFFLVNANESTDKSFYIDDAVVRNQEAVSGNASLSRNLINVMLPGKSYSLSAWINLGKSPGGEVTMSVVKKYVSGTVETTSLGTIDLTDFGYQELTGTYTLQVSSGETLEQLDLLIEAPGGAIIVVDDVTVREVVATSRGVSIDWLELQGIPGDPEVNQDLDHDFDGVPTWLEFATGTLPLDPDSFFRITEFTLNSSGQNVLTWSGSRESGGLLGWNVWSSTDLENWYLLEENIVRDPLSTGLNTFTEPFSESSPRVFYRIELPWRQ
ncbi:MAG: sulfatase-like hydrolase/transferase [Verrucomicrobiota bacterium]